MDKVLEKRDLPKLTQADIKTLKCPECLAEIEPVIRHPPTKKSAGPEGSLVNLPLGKDEYTPALASAKKRKKKRDTQLTYQNPWAGGPHEHHTKS